MEDKPCTSKEETNCTRVIGQVNPGNVLCVVEETIVVYHSTKTTAEGTQSFLFTRYRKTAP